MARTRTRPWDAADHLESDEDIVAYLEAAFEDGVLAQAQTVAVARVRDWRAGQSATGSAALRRRRREATGGP